MLDWRWILDELPVGVWVGNVPSGEVVYSNKAFERIFGMPADRSYRSDDPAPPRKLFDRDNQPYPRDKLLFIRVLESRLPATADDMVVHDEGRHTNIRGFGAPLFAPDGTMTHIALAFSDITDEVTAQREWASAKDRLTFVCNHAPISMWATDTQGTVTLSEGAALAALGVKPGELVGSNIFELYKDHPTVPGHFERALAGESFWYTAADGKVIFESWLTPLRDESGKMLGLAGFSNDVTELRSLQNTIVKNDRVNALGTLAASMAHEINNPLTYVMGHGDAANLELDHLESLLEAVSGPQRSAIRVSIERIREELGPVLSGTARIATITRDLQSFSHADDATLGRIEVGAAVDAVVKLVGKEVRAQAQLVINVEPALYVVANEARLIQILFNLVVNAKQALPSTPTESHCIQVRAYSENSFVIIEVEDTGPGVADENHERIFEPMFSTKEVGAGMGLGLFVCRNIARSLSGDIVVMSAPERGALFRVTLPSPSHKASMSPQRAGSERCVTANGHIVLIDDDELVLRVLTAKLKRDGFRVTVFHNAITALASLKGARDVDLIFCDLMMPDMTGMDFAEAIAEQAPGLVPQLLFMTGGAFSPRAQDFVSENSQRTLRKPFDIVAAAKRWLASRTET